MKSWDCLLTYWHPMTSILSQKKSVLNATNSNAIISKPKNICSIFFWISAIFIKFIILWEKRWDAEVICFWNYRLQKPGLLITMAKKPRIRTLMDSQHVKEAKPLDKSERQYLSQILWSLWKKSVQKTLF